MTLTADFGPHGPDQPSYPLASTGGWTDVHDYVAGLSEDAYPELYQVLAYGVSGDIPALVREIDAALRDDPPPDETVRSTLEQLRSHAHAERDSGVVVVSAGVDAEPIDDTPDDDPEAASATVED